MVSFTDLAGAQGLRLQQVISSATLSEKIEQTEAFFLRLLNARSRAAEPKITASLQLIQKHNGMIAIQQLANAPLLPHPASWSASLTLSLDSAPNDFANIIRAHAFLKHLRAPSRLTGKAHETGYFDQAHLIREFKQITGLTPSQYLKKTVPLAVNLLWIPA